MTTPQETMKTKLAGLGIPHRRIECYGSQIVVTCLSDSAARKFAAVIGKFAKVRGIVRTEDYTADADKCPNERYKHVVDVVRVFACV